MLQRAWQSACKRDSCDPVRLFPENLAIQSTLTGAVAPVLHEEECLDTAVRHSVPTIGGGQSQARKGECAFLPCSQEDPMHVSSRMHFGMWLYN